MSLNGRLFPLTQGFRGRLAGATPLGLGAAAAGVGHLALSGYVLGLVFQGQPVSALRLPVLGVAVCILRRAGFEYSREVIGNCTAGVITLRLRQWIGHSNDLRSISSRLSKVEESVHGHEMTRRGARLYRR
jgi:hypothetical protein